MPGAKLAHALSAGDLEKADHTFDRIVVTVADKPSLLSAALKAKQIQVVTAKPAKDQFGHEAQLDALVKKVGMDSMTKQSMGVKMERALPIEKSKEIAKGEINKTYGATKDYRETEKGQEIERSRSRGRGR